jgi:DNA-binding transcriptional LysR family regulator
MSVSTFDLRLFAAVVDQGGMAAAARALGREKSTVSRDIAALEARLGVRLLHRTTRNITPTEAGEVFLAHARRVAEEIEHVEAAIEALSDEPRGLLRVTAPYAIIRFVIAPRLKAFQDRYPDLRVALEATTDVLDLVERGIDVAIRIGDLAASSLVARKIGEARQILFAARAYLEIRGAPKTPADLSQHALVDLSSQPRASWRLTRQDGAVETIAVAPMLSVADPAIALDLAREGMGVTVAPDLYVRGGALYEELLPVLPEWSFGARPIHALYPSRRLLTPKVRVFVDFAAESLDFLARRTG